MSSIFQYIKCKVKMLMFQIQTYSNIFSCIFRQNFDECFSLLGQLSPHTALSWIHFTAMSSSTLPTVDTCAASLQREGCTSIVNCWIMMNYVVFYLCFLNGQSMSVPACARIASEAWVLLFFFKDLLQNLGRSLLRSTCWSCLLEWKKRSLHRQARDACLILFKVLQA